MIAEQTTHLGLPLPHQDNPLEEDVLRLRAALAAIDGKFYALDALLASNDASLDSIQEIVTALKGSVATVSALSASFAAHAGNMNNPHSTTANQIGALSTSARGAVNGVASLDADRQVPYAQMKSAKMHFSANS